MGNNNSAATRMEENMKKVANLIDANKVMIFSATYCSYCRVAKRTFDDLGTKYEAIELNKAEDGKDLVDGLSELTGSKLVSIRFKYNIFAL